MGENLRKWHGTDGSLLTFNRSLQAILKRFKDPDSNTHLAAIAATKVLGGDKSDNLALSEEIMKACVEALNAPQDSKREAAVGLLRIYAFRGEPSVVAGEQKSGPPSSLIARWT